jgi:hypothetical protein
MWNARYEVVRSARDSALHIIFVEGKFSEIPDRDRRLGPWHSLATGSIANLKPHYRTQIGTTGYILVRQQPGSFSPEPRQTSRANPVTRPKTSSRRSRSTPTERSR